MGYFKTAHSQSRKDKILIYTEDGLKGYGFFDNIYCSSKTTKKLWVCGSYMRITKEEAYDIFMNNDEMRRVGSFEDVFEIEWAITEEIEI